MFKALAIQLTPSNEGVIVTFMVYLFGINWKSSLSGILSLGIAAFAPITAGLAPLAALNPHSTVAQYLAIASGIMTMMSGVGVAWVQLLMKDAGTVPAKVPGNPDPQIVPSTEVPVDPKNKVIK